MEWWWTVFTGDAVSKGGRGTGANRKERQIKRKSRGEGNDEQRKRLDFQKGFFSVFLLQKGASHSPLTLTTDNFPLKTWSLCWQTQTGIFTLCHSFVALETWRRRVEPSFFPPPSSSSSHILCFSVWVRVQCGGCWQNALCKMSETSIWGRAVDLNAGKGGERKHQVLSSQGRFEMRRICSDHLLDRPSLTGAEGFFFFFLNLISKQLGWYLTNLSLDPTESSQAVFRTLIFAHFLWWLVITRHQSSSCSWGRLPPHPSPWCERRHEAVQVILLLSLTVPVV